MTPERFEGRLVEWLQPREPTEKPLLLVLAPMGTGKTVAFLQAEAELAECAQGNLESPLPLRLRAVELVGVAFDELLRRKGFPDLERLWVDPLCSWVLLVDGLDEIDERAQRDVLRTLLAQHDTRKVMGLAVSCRTSHDHPRLFPEALRVELPPWSGEESATFLRRWERTPQGGEIHEEIRALLDSDSSLRANALCNTLLAAPATTATAEAPRGRQGRAPLAADPGRRPDGARPGAWSGGHPRVAWASAPPVERRGLELETPAPGRGGKGARAQGRCSLGCSVAGVGSIAAHIRQSGRMVGPPRARRREVLAGSAPGAGLGGSRGGPPETGTMEAPA